MDPAKLRVIIPVGGEATRMKPLTVESSKAIIRILNRPLVEFAMAELALQGVRDFIFGVKGYYNYRGLFAYFEEGIGFSARYGISPRAHIKYQPHIDDVGSADSIRINMEYYDIDSHVMVVQGDNPFEMELSSLLAFHEEKQAVMTIVLTHVDDVERFGVANLASDNRIKEFVEKPKKEEAPSRLANTGMYVLSPKVRELFSHPSIQKMILEKKRLDFGMDLIPFLVQEGYPVYGYLLEGIWYDVGTPKSYLDTMLRILKSESNLFYVREPHLFRSTSSTSRKFIYRGEPPLTIPNVGNIWIQGQSSESLWRKDQIITKIREGKIRLEGSVLIGRHCQIGDGSIIRDSCVDNFCIIGENATIERSAIMDRVLIGDGTTIQDSIIGRHAEVKSTRSHPTWIHGVSVIADDALIGEGCVITETKVYPHKVIPYGQKMANQVIE